MLQLQIENSNLCNARCVFCPYDAQTRKRMVMGMDLYRKILDEAGTIPILERLTITGLGEPTIDKELIEKIAYARKVMHPKTEIDCYTNGSFLDAEYVRGLEKVGLSVLYVSINAIDNKKRQEIMGIDGYDVLEALLVKMIRELKKMRIVVKGVQEKDLFDGEEATEFVRKWGGLVEPGKNGRAFLHLEGNWAGWNYPVRTTQRNACCRATNHIMVLSDGRVCLCCQDYDGKVIFGDLNNQTLREIYRTEAYVNYRKSHMEGRRNELELCRTCTMI